MEVLIILPLIAAGALLKILWYRNEKDIFKAVIGTILLLSFFVFVSTEGLSLFSLLTPLVFKVLWVLFSTVVLFLLHKVEKSAPEKGSLFLVSIGILKRKKNRLLVIVVMLVLSGTFISGFFGSPNTCDALIYHIPRVLHWVQNGNVDYYASHIERQLWNPPFFEYCLLHTWLLTNSDRFFYLIQWTAFVGCMSVGVSMARTLKLSQLGISITLLFVATLPIAIMQASSPKNDLFFAFLLCAFAYYLFEAIKTFTWYRGCLAGIALGLAIATKGTAYILAPAIGVPLGIYWLRNSSLISPFVRSAVRLVGIALLGVLLASPQMARSYKCYGSFVSSGSDEVTNEDYSPLAVYGNVLRMVASNVALPIPAINKRLECGFKTIGVGQLNNKRNIWLGDSGRSFEMDAAPTETKMSNPIHMILFLVAAIWLSCKRNENATIKMLVLVSLAVFAIFAIMIKWSEWVTRYHIASFILAAPLVGHVLALPLRSIRGMRIVILPPMALLAVVCSLFNVYRPIIPFRNVSALCTPRYDQFFMYDNSSRKDQYQRKKEMEYVANAAFNRVDLLDGKRAIGLMCTAGATEYLFWKIAEEESVHDNVAFQHVYVDNPSRRFLSNKKVPNIIIVSSKMLDYRVAAIEKDGFRRVFTEGNWEVYESRQP